MSSNPFAVVDGPPQRRHIVLADARATRAGVRAGQPLAAAQMLCPRLCVAPRDEAAERRALESLAACAYRFSAEVAIAAPDAILVEVGASLALFGGWAALERRLRAELDGFGFAYTLAAAPTAAGARVLSAQADGLAILSLAQLGHALGAVPLAASGLPEKAVAALHGMGFRALRDLFRLPRVELARRIGPDAQALLDRMRGLAGETFPRWQPPDRFERRIEFPSGIESQHALAFPLQRLIREFALFLATRDGGVQRFALVLGHEHGASTRIGIGLLAPQRDATALLEFARARFDRIELVAAVHSLTLCADDLPSLCPLHRDLFDTNRRQQLDWPSLAERLRARLGDAALRGLRCAEDHRPGRAWRYASVIEPTTRSSRGSGFSRDALKPSPSRDEPGFRAALLRAGERLHTDVLASARMREGLGGKGVHHDRSIAAEAAPTKADTLRRAATSTPAENAAKTRPFWLLRRPILLHGGALRILAGPERIESGWWDEHDQRRDYYIVQTRSGQRAWAFVEAGTIAAAAPGGVPTNWTLHGWFA
ncbi:MAG: Y-family DNA polymerase [Lysobacterales bacterium]